MQLFKTIDRACQIHALIQKEATGTPDEFAKRLHISRRLLYYLLDELYDELIYSDLTTIYGGNKMPDLENVWDFFGFLIKSHARSIMYTAEGGGNASNIGC